MKKFIKIGPALVAAAVLIAGCGDEMVVLTESEESVIVNYSAGTLAKHNSYQQEGMSAVYPKEEEEEEEPSVAGEEEKKEPEAEGQEPEGGSQGSQQDSGDGENPNAVSMTEALAVPGVEFSYQDYSVYDSYRQGDYYSADAAEGNVFLILNVNISNIGTEAVSCDLLGKQPIFTLKINGEAGVKNEVTMLENDIATYTATLEPGQTVAGILLFEVPAETGENVSSLQLSMQMGGVASEIIMK